MPIDGIKISNFRSFDETGVTIANFGRVNIFIGKNNSGKSNVINFISKIPFTLNPPTSSEQIFRPHDYHNYEVDRKITFSLQYNKGSNLEKIISPSVFIGYLKNYFNNIPHIWQAFKFSGGEKKLYEIDKSYPNWISQTLPKGEELKKIILDNYHSANSNDRENILDIYNRLLPTFHIETKTIFYIQAFRKIENNGNSYPSDSFEHIINTFNGINVIKEISILKSPNAVESAASKKKFKKIESFLQNVLNNPKITLSVSAKSDELQLEDKETEQITPLSNFGTGIHQLIVLAISVTQMENCIFCIEEPELFLHPEIQKKFISYLLNETTNQYFLTTHSSSFLNIEGTDIYHVKNDGTCSSVIKVKSSLEKYEVLDELGYHASDIMQTNFILWVEGPSDRIYLNHWISNKNNDLIEGVHYSIMFYGGRLLSHLSSTDEDINSFIKLNKINRNIAILIDSDKDSESKELNSTKERIKKEFNDMNYFVWVTEGREIENYIDTNNYTTSLTIFTNILPSDINNKYSKRTINKDQKSIDKVKLAKYIAGIDPVYTTLDLNEKIDNIIDRIKKANRLK